MQVTLWCPVGILYTSFCHVVIVHGLLTSWCQRQWSRGVMCHVVRASPGKGADVLMSLPTPETHGETGSVHPKQSNKAAPQHVKQKN